jgi:hypothetical protein
MPIQSRIIFVHRNNLDRSYDSICTTCHATIASENVEAELAQTRLTTSAIQFGSANSVKTRSLSDLCRECT